MPLYIKDDVTAELVAELAELKKLSKQDAVKQAVLTELARIRASVPLHERLARMRARNPLPPLTGTPAGKAVFDDLSGNL